MEIMEFGEKSADIVLVQPVDNHDLKTIDNEVKVIGELTNTKFHLLAIKVDNWNKDLSPWEAPPVFGNEAFGGGADETLKLVKEISNDDSKLYYIGGYSLAALFSLWAAYETELFEGVAAASPSAWFPGFEDYMKERRIKCDCVYLSLGDREAKTRNPVVSKVANCIRNFQEILTSQGVACTLEWNKGNHFKDADLRTAKAFAAVMEGKKR